MKWFKLLFLTLTLTLFGCGGDESSNTGTGDITPPTVQPVNGALKAMSMSLATPVRKANSAALTTLSLQPYVWSQDKKTLSLTDVKALSKDSACQVADIQTERLTFSLPANHSGACLYRYTVTDSSQQQASGIIRVVVSPNATGVRWGPLPVGNELDDINQSTTLDNTLTLDLSTDPAIAGEVTGMSHPLFSETTIVNGSGTATLTPEGQFSFQAIAPGSTEVMYYILDDQYTEDTSDDDVYIGRVLISVSGSTNTPPTADNGVLSTPVAYASTIEIDVADFPDATEGTLIHDEDASLLHKEPLQLVYVQADDVFVELSNPNDVTNTKFKVQTPVSPRSEGYHETQVHYAIYDHNEDGIAQGTIRLLVGKTLTSISIAPTDSTTSGTGVLSIAKGQRQGFVAIGTFDDGSQELITHDVSWSSSAPVIASINPSGVAKGLSVGHTNISASITTLDGRPLNSNVIDLEVTDAELVNFWLTPASQELPLGALGGITATGLYTDGTTAPISQDVSWSASPTNIVTIDASMSGGTHPEAEVRADNMGTTIVTATLDGLPSLNSATVVVTEKAVSSVQLTPANTNNLPKGRKKQMTAVVSYTNGSTLDVTLDPLTVWSTADTDIAEFSTPSAPGKVTAVDLGTTTATATYGGVTSNKANITVTDAVVKSITVNPASASVPKGARTLLNARATYTDGTQRQVSLEASWEGNDTGIATVNKGVVYGVEEGTTTVTANLDGKVSNEVTINVTKAELKQIRITTLEPFNVEAGASQPLTAVALFTDHQRLDITNTAAWSTEDTSVATVTSPGGMVTAAGDAIGQQTVAKVEYAGKQDTITVHVTEPAIDHIVVEPKDAVMLVGESVQYTATGIYENYAETDITHNPDTSWSSTAPSVATVDSDGEVTAVAVGTTTIKATYDGKENETSLDVLRVPPLWGGTLTFGSQYMFIGQKHTPTIGVLAPVDPPQWFNVANYYLTSDDPGVLVVTADGKTLEAVGEGEAEICAHADAWASTICRDIEVKGCLADTIEPRVTVVSPQCEGLWFATGPLTDEQTAAAGVDDLVVDHYDYWHGDYDYPPEFTSGGTQMVMDIPAFSNETALQLCDRYNEAAVGGRTNWRLPKWIDTTAPTAVSGTRSWDYRGEVGYPAFFGRSWEPFVGIPPNRKTDYGAPLTGGYRNIPLAMVQIDANTLEAEARREYDIPEKDWIDPISVYSAVAGVPAEAAGTVVDQTSYDYNYDHYWGLVPVGTAIPLCMSPSSPPE